MDTKKKLHWTQRPENKAKLKAMHKKGAATVRAQHREKPKSKAEAIVKKQVGKKATADMGTLYSRATEAAVARGEVSRLMSALGHALLVRELGGGK